MRIKKNNLTAAPSLPSKTKKGHFLLLCTKLKMRKIKRETQFFSSYTSLCYKRKTILEEEKLKNKQKLTNMKCSIDVIEMQGLFF